MAVSDYIKPVQEHVSGIPSNVRLVMSTMSERTNKVLLASLRTAYDKQVTLIEATLAGKDLEGMPIPADREELAAALAAHLIIDCALLHETLARCKVPVGAFPFDHLAQKLLPKKEAEHDTDRNDNNPVV